MSDTTLENISKGVDNQGFDNESKYYEVHSNMAEINALKNDIEDLEENIAETTEHIDQINKEIDDIDDNIVKVQKSTRRLNILIVIEIILLLIILLFSFTIGIISKHNLTLYKATLQQTPIVVESERLVNYNTESLLETGISNGYTIACDEFYYSPEDETAYIMNGKTEKSSSDYYDLDGLMNQVQSKQVTYEVKDVALIEEISKDKSVTEIRQNSRNYDIGDGVCEIIKGTDSVFLGFNSNLIDKYSQNIVEEKAERDNIKIVIDGKQDIDEAFIERMFYEVIEDTYMNNTDKTEKAKSNYNDYYFGLEERNNRLYYVKSHSIDAGSESRVIIEKVDITDKVTANIQKYLADDVKVEYRDVSDDIILKNKTEICLRSETKAHDALYLYMLS